MESPEQMVERFLGRMKDKFGLELSVVEKYEFISEPDACPICKKLDGEIFDVDDMEIGKNAPIIHAHCRCSTAAYMDRDEWDADLRRGGL